MRALARWGITPLLVTPLGAWAVGLGDIELQSALNQPFQAEIQLVSATPEELQSLRVTLASPETFTRYGLDRPAFLSALEFRVVTDRSGRGVVRVSSRESIAEPFVTLLVEAVWPRGRLLREYTVLLDPPVLLPAPAAPPAVRPAESRAPASSAPGGVIERPGPAPAAPAPAPRVQPSEPVSSAPPATPRVPASAPGGTYGPVQRAETLWAIAERFRPEGITINQMMMAIYRDNPDAFGGNINLLRAGASLRLPDASDLETLSTTVANSEVQRHTDEWLARASTPSRELRLLPPSTDVVPVASPAPAPAPVTPEPAPAPVESPIPAGGAAVANEPDNRPIEIGSEALEAIQEQAAAVDEPLLDASAEPAAPGVDLESEQLFTDESPEPEVAEQPAPAPAPVVRAQQPAAPSLVSQVLDWVLSPLLWIGLGVAALLLTALWFVRRRRQEPEDVTGRWEALESEVDDEEVREATARMRRQVADDSLIVEEAERPRRSAEPENAPRRSGAATAGRAAAAGAAAAAAAATAEETLSSQTVINLDQADPVAEADFHIAYGLYDQAADLVQKAIEAAPERRDLKVKLLEVYFMWGNKDAFLKAAQSLRREIGDGADPDWDQVVIMGRQICPDERLFTEATTGPGRVDVDLQAGDSPLDLAFDDALIADADAGGTDIGAGLDIDFGEETEETATKPAPKAPKPAAWEREEESLDIGERTAAGLEAALFMPEADDEDTGRRTTPDIAADSLAVTQESPTIERPGAPWGDSEGQYTIDAPTVETPTVESLAANAPTMETPTIETPFRGGEPPTVEQPGFSSAGEFTAEINLDDLGLDVKDIEDLPTDLGDLPMAADRETDTREQPVLQPDDDELLSATGVTQVLRADDDEFERKTSVLGDQDATMLAPGFDDGTLTGTEVLAGRFEVDESGDTSLVKALDRKDESVDLDLDDLTSALHGADTVEQPRVSSFSNDVFGGGDTPVDLDIGSDFAGSDDPTGTEEASPLDPQTMTEVGTKLDLARAYIDMGDPEGARSILEEVLDEGDPSQRREAQSLIDVLRA